MRGWCEFTAYSVLHGCVMMRLSCAGEGGREYWAQIPAGAGKKWRERRDAVLDQIEAAIARGCDPGEVWLDDEDAERPAA